MSSLGMSGGEEGDMTLYEMVEYLYTKSGGDTYEETTSGLTEIGSYTGNQSSITISSIFDDWADLTADDFICVITSIPLVVSADGSDPARASGATPSWTYTDGVLTTTGFSQTVGLYGSYWTQKTTQSFTYTVYRINKLAVS